MIAPLVEAFRHGSRIGAATPLVRDDGRESGMTVERELQSSVLNNPASSFARGTSEL